MSPARPGDDVIYILPDPSPNAGQARPAKIVRKRGGQTRDAVCDLIVFGVPADGAAWATGVALILDVLRDQNLPGRMAQGRWATPP